MRKDELIKENRRLKKDLSDVCEHHKRLTKILYQKIDENSELRKQLKNVKKPYREYEKAEPERKRSI